MYGGVGEGPFLWELKGTREREEVNKTDSGKEEKEKTMEGIKVIGNESRTLSALSDKLQSKT